MNHYNLAASLIGSLFGILSLFSIILNSHALREWKSNSYNRWMAALIVTCLVGSLSEITFELVNGNVFPFSREINITAKIINSLESYLSGFLFVGFIRAVSFKDEKRWPRHLRIVTATVTILSIFLLTTNLFTGILFTVNSENVYARGPLGQLGLMSSFATLVYCVILMSVENRKNKTYLRFPVFLYAMPFFIGGGIQIFIQSMRLAGVSFALGIITMHLNIQRTLLYTDAMTGVYNRAYLDYYFSEAAKREVGKAFGGIMVDINSFKEINDTYGHLVGDNAIREAAEIIKNAVDANSLIVRYGGDEFIIIKENEKRDGMRALKERINKAAREYNEGSDNPYDIDFSIGMTVHYISPGTFDQFLEQMDESLYLDKKAYYEYTGKERRR